ncbi:unnamed protein product [Cochlearia groenlandica]
MRRRLSNAKLPSELEEDILSRLPPISLVRFKAVCKQWNALLSDKRFVSQHSSRYRTPQFIIVTKSKIYSINIIDLNTNDPTIVSRELYSSDINSPNCKLNYTVVTCDELLLCKYWNRQNKITLWNPSLGKVKRFEYKTKGFRVFGFGYDNSKPEKVYKIIGYFRPYSRVGENYYIKVAIYDCVSGSFNYIDTSNEERCLLQEPKRARVSLNGNIYWLCTTGKCFIGSFDFPGERFIKPFCDLPCQKTHHRDELFLEVYKGDCFSVLKQCYVTKKIEIWVTEKKIENINDNGKGVVWINLMTLQANSLPNLYGKVYGVRYFIYGDNALIMCCRDHESSKACIYISRGDLFKKIPIDFVTGSFSQCVYVPTLISVPLDL